MRGHETGGNTLALDLVRSLGPGMLLLGDRGFGGSYVLFGAMAATGADLLWRVKSSAQLPVLERFSDGSYRSELVIKDDKGRKQQVLSVRVVVYEICELYPLSSRSTAKCSFWDRHDRARDRPHAVHSGRRDRSRAAP